MKAQIKSCVICDKEFLAERNRICCSPECSAERKRQITREAAHKYKKIHVRNRNCTCKWCGKEYVRTKTNLYCSEECRYEAKKAQAREYYRRSKQNEERRPTDGRNLICECCGKPFATRHTRKYCSEECAKYMSRKKSRIYNQQRREEIKMWGMPIASNKNKRYHEAEITKTAAAAKDVGMSYGQYVAMRYMEQTGIGRVQV